MPERFWNKVDASGPCWLWTGALSGGYGSFQGRLAHREAWELLVGPIPPGMELDHLCRVTHCINPDHLEVVTHRTNMQRAAFWNRNKTMCKNGHPYDEANTHVRPSGKRRCRACEREWRRRYVARLV
jgi:hypothetical protein